VVAGNARARRFYERSGWVDEGLFTQEDADTAVVAAVEDFLQAALRRVPGTDEEVEVVLHRRTVGRLS
jgi:hypothetical protein